jgi:hypothetical protein
MPPTTRKGVTSAGIETKIATKNSRSVARG